MRRVLVVLIAAAAAACAGSGPAADLVQYNLGTTRLLRRDYGGARAPLEAAARSAETGLRARAAYNLGNTDLEPAFASKDSTEGQGRQQALRRAIEAYEHALLAAPADSDAKWNLELARRLLAQGPKSPTPNQNPSGGGGGGGGGGGAESQTGTRSPAPRPAGGGGPAPSLSRARAEEVLAGAQERELGTQEEKLRKPQPTHPVAH
ncbi:MAG TPA: hypothetical protein VFL93_13505 [Longimicrobiaceae bacterium]|nr:hypothetical protein [Longimicrobiaceae bacterium]